MWDVCSPVPPRAAQGLRLTGDELRLTLLGNAAQTALVTAFALSFVLVLGDGKLGKVACSHLVFTPLPSTGKAGVRRATWRRVE